MSHKFGLYLTPSPPSVMLQYPKPFALVSQKNPPTLWVSLTSFINLERITSLPLFHYVFLEKLNETSFKDWANFFSPKVLCFFTSKWVLCTLFAGRNHLFFPFVMEIDGKTCFNVKRIDFDQWTACGAPISQSKYMTQKP